MISRAKTGLSCGLVKSSKAVDSEYLGSWELTSSFRMLRYPSLVPRLPRPLVQANGTKSKSLVAAKASRALGKPATTEVPQSAIQASGRTAVHV